jgi:hypothetical protein
MEMRPKGKPANDEPGPYSVNVFFSDGSTLRVRENVAGDVATRVFDEHCHGIGAIVGTTRQVTITDESDRVHNNWVHSLRKEMESKLEFKTPGIGIIMSGGPPNYVDCFPQFIAADGKRYYRDPNMGYMFYIDHSTGLLIDPATGFKYVVDPTGRVQQV